MRLLVFDTAATFVLIHFSLSVNSDILGVWFFGTEGHRSTKRTIPVAFPTRLVLIVDVSRLRIKVLTVRLQRKAVLPTKECIGKQWHQGTSPLFMR